MPKTDPAREALLTALEASGVSIPLWDGILIEETVRIAPGATILPGCILRGNTTIAAGSVICPGSVLTDAVIGKNCIVKNTYITESTLEENVSIGPFSQVRPGCHIAAGCKIGDFVEVKNSHIGQKTAIAHLTYVGDTDCGSGVNFGCGVAIANFNGKEKFRTTIGDDAFTAALKAYVSEYYLENARPDCLIACFEKASGKELKSYFDSWTSGKVKLFAD